MNLVAYAFIFLVGGIAAIIIMRSLFYFWGRSFRKNQDDQYLKRIADILQ